MNSLRGKVTIISDECFELKKKVEERLKNIENLNNSWNEKKEFWQQLQKQNNVVESTYNTYAKNLFQEKNKTIDKAFKLFEGADKPILNLNNKITDLNKATNNLADDLDRLIQNLRKRLFKKSGNAMLSIKYFREFKNLFNQSNRNEEYLNKKGSIGEIFNNYAWVFVLQIIIFILVALYLKNVKEDFMSVVGLNFLHKNYIASSLIISVLVGIPLVLESYPPLVKLVYTILICIGTAIIFCGKIPNKSIKAGVVLVFILYVLYKIFDLGNIPSVLSQLVMAIVSLASGIYFLKLNELKEEESFTNETEESTEKTDNNIENPDDFSLKIQLANKILGIFLIIAFILQIAGYTALANHIYHITLKSILIILLTWVTLDFLYGCVKIFLSTVIVTKYLKNVIPDKERVGNTLNTIITIVTAYFVIAGILSAWGFYDNVLLASKSILSLGITIQDTRITLGNVFWAIFLFYIVLGISWCVRSTLETSFYPKRNIELGVGISINRLIYYSFIVIAVAIAMGVLGISFQSLMVIIGALGVGIGFGLQNIVNNFASGLILLFERSIKVGDIVVVNGTWGTVKHLGLRATIIQTFANAEMIVPNSDLVSSTVNNWTMTNRQTRFSVKVGVAYGTDPNLVKKVLLNIANTHSNVLKDPAPSVVFNEFGDSSLNFELRCWVKEINIMWKTQDEIMYKIDKEFKENNIAIPFPQRDLYIKEMPSDLKDAVSGMKDTVPGMKDTVSEAKDAVSEIEPKTKNESKPKTTKSRYKRYSSDEE